MNVTVCVGPSRDTRLGSQSAGLLVGVPEPLVDIGKEIVQPPPPPRVCVGVNIA